MLSFNSRSTARALAAFALSALPALAQGWTEDNYQTTDRNAPYYRRPVAGYIPTVTPAVVFTVLFAVLAVVSWIHYARRKALVWLPIGHTAMTAGFAVRIAGHFMPFSIPIYSVSQILILLSPCAYLAVCYQLLGKMAISLGSDVAHNCLLLRVSLITKIFVTSDIITFVIQAAGSGMQATEGNAKLGHDLAMAGLIIQIISFGTYFLLLVPTFAIRTRKMYPVAWHRSDGTFSRSPGFVVRHIFSRQDFDAWKVVFWANIWACVGLMIRCVFRVVEYSQGFDGVIATNEAYIYCLDSLPLFFGLGIFCILYPARFLPSAVFAKGAISHANQLELGQREPEKTYGSQ